MLSPNLWGPGGMESSLGKPWGIAASLPVLHQQSKLVTCVQVLLPRQSVMQSGRYGLMEITGTWWVYRRVHWVDTPGRYFSTVPRRVEQPAQQGHMSQPRSSVSQEVWTSIEVWTMEVYLFSPISRKSQA